MLWLAIFGFSHLQFGVVGLDVDTCDCSKVSGRSLLRKSDLDCEVSVSNGSALLW